MNKRTAKALEASIKHWEENAAVDDLKDASVDAENCALCDLFNGGDNDPWCKGCPVFKKTGYQLCQKSPWMEASAEIFGLLADFKHHAQREVDFLKGLRE